MNERFRSLIYDSITWVQNNEAIVVGATIIGLLFALILTVMFNYYKSAGERRMRKADELAKKRMLSDKITDLLLELSVEGKLTTKDVQDFTRKLGLNADMHDLVPRKSQKALKTEIKRRLYSNNKRATITKPDGQVVIDPAKVHNTTNPNRQHVEYDPVVIVPATPKKKESIWKRIRLARPYSTVAPQ